MLEDCFFAHNVHFTYMSSSFASTKELETPELICILANWSFDDVIIFKSKGNIKSSKKQFHLNIRWKNDKIFPIL